MLRMTILKKRVGSVDGKPFYIEHNHTLRDNSKDTDMFLMKRKQKKPTHTVYHFPVGTVVKLKPDVTHLDELLNSRKLIVRSGMVWGFNSKHGDVCLNVMGSDGRKRVVERVDICHLDIVKRGNGASAATQLNLRERNNYVMALKRLPYTHANKTHYIVTEDRAFKLFYHMVWKVMGDGVVACKLLAGTGGAIRDKLIKQGLHKQITIDGITYDMYNKKRIVAWFRQNVNRVTIDCRKSWCAQRKNK